MATTHSQKDLSGAILQEATDQTPWCVQSTHTGRLNDLIERSAADTKAITLATRVFDILRGIRWLEWSGLILLKWNRWNVHHTRIEWANENRIFGQRNDIDSVDSASICDIATGNFLALKLYVKRDEEIAAIGKIDHKSWNLLPLDETDYPLLEKFLDEVKSGIQLPEETPRRGSR